MVEYPNRGQSILVETPESIRADQNKIRGASSQWSALAGYITSRVNIWEDVRNRGYQRMWGEYWRMWRGKWNEEDKNRLSERSKLVSPALAQAIEQTISEIEEAIFSKEEWFDAAKKVEQDIKAQIQDLMLRDKLLGDLELVNAQDQIMEAIMNGALFGTMIAKVNVFVGEEQKPKRNEATFELQTTSKKRVFVSIESIRPDQFIPDPQGRTIQQMEGCAIRYQRPMHYVLERVQQGVYRKDALIPLFPTRRLKNSDIDQEDPQSVNTTYESQQVDIIEWHGKVPARMLEPAMGEKEEESPLDTFLEKNGLNPGSLDYGNGPLVEAIVTIANNGIVLRAMVNPFVLKDRSVVAAQFEKVPARFWGRGIAEKGYNPQKALDAELRARMDALGYISAPMLGVDSGRIPKGFKFEVRPGKVWTTQGPPKDVLQPVSVGDYNTLTFQQTQEMERMVQMGTGSFDTATALRQQSQSGANGASANSALMGAFVKRSKRSIANISRNFLKPLIDKCMWRYMQFDPIRYPTNFAISIKTTLGIVAREVEAAQMTQLMGMLPQELHQVQLVLAKGIIEHTSLSNKAEIMQVIDGILNPTPQQQQQQQKMQQLQDQAAQAALQEQMGKVAKLQAEVDNLKSETLMHQHEMMQDHTQSQQEWRRLQIQNQEADQFGMQNRIAMAELPIKRLAAEASMIKAKKPAARAA